MSRREGGEQGARKAAHVAAKYLKAIKRREREREERQSGERGREAKEREIFSFHCRFPSQISMRVYVCARMQMQVSLTPSTGARVPSRERPDSGDRDRDMDRESVRVMIELPESTINLVDRIADLASFAL